MNSMESFFGGIDFIHENRWLRGPPVVPAVERSEFQPLVRTPSFRTLVPDTCPSDGH